MTTLSAGSQYSITQNTIYALPVTACQILSAAVCQLSPTTTTTQFTDVAATTTGVQTGAMFVRCTTGTTQISVKNFK